MAGPHELVRDVNFQEPGFAGSLTYNEAYGFLQDSAAGLTLVGFATPLDRQGGMDARTTVAPLTEFAELPPEHQTIDEQGKGVGPRLYNTLSGLGGAKVRPPEVGVYSVDLDPDKILDLRAEQGGRVRQIARHAGRIVRSRVAGVERTVEGIHRSYGEADAVLLKQPPHPELRQKLHGVADPIDVNPAFLVIRNPNLRLHRVGTAPSPW